MPIDRIKPGKTRRRFVQTSGTVAAGLGLAGQAAAYATHESLAIDGGEKSVTTPAGRQAALSRWPRYGSGEKKALHDLIDSNKFYEELPAFEREWKDYTKAAFVKSHINGTGALTSMYFALDLPPGSEIMVPSFTFFSTCLTMRFFGLVPIFVDINPRTSNFDLDDAKRRLTPRTKALVPVHWLGLPCEMDQIQDFAREKGLILLEDAAHAHGASMQGKMMGTWGEMGIYSFQATKPMPSVEGGMGMYRTREHFERAAVFGHYRDARTLPETSPMRKYMGSGLGQKYRMHPFAAAVARQQLRALDDLNAVVERNVRALNNRLLQLPGLSEPPCRPDQKRVYYNHNMLFLDSGAAGFSREALRKALAAEGVRIRCSEYAQQHQLPVYSEARWWHHKPTIPATMPGNEQVNRTRFFLPLFYEDAPELVAQYGQAFEKVWAHRTALAKM